jgi:hypothetical protein
MKRIRLIGKDWRLRFVSAAKLEKLAGEKVEGLCDSPEGIGKAIYIDKNLCGKTQLEVLIHEMTHGANHHLDEEFVEQFAVDVSHVLWKLGWRPSS